MKWLLNLRKGNKLITEDMLQQEFKKMVEGSPLLGKIPYNQLSCDFFAQQLQVNLVNPSNSTDTVVIDLAGQSATERSSRLLPTPKLTNPFREAYFKGKEQ